jgi:hypothetical protein
MVAGDRLVWRSSDHRVTVSGSDPDPVRLFIRESDGTAGEVDLRDLVAELASIGLDAPPAPAEGVEVGWLEDRPGTRFVVDGRRRSAMAGLELVASGIVAAIRQAVEDLEAGRRSPMGPAQEDRGDG